MAGGPESLLFALLCTSTDVNEMVVSRTMAPGAKSAEAFHTRQLLQLNTTVYLIVVSCEEICTEADYSGVILNQRNCFKLPLVSKTKVF